MWHAGGNSGGPAFNADRDCCGIAFQSLKVCCSVTQMAPLSAVGRQDALHDGESSPCRMRMLKASATWCLWKSLSTSSQTLTAMDATQVSWRPVGHKQLMPAAAGRAGIQTAGRLAADHGDDPPEVHHIWAQGRLG